MDAGRYGTRAVEVLASIAARSRCVQMQVGPLDAAADAVEHVIADAPTTLPVQVLDGTADPGIPWHVAEYVRSVLIGERTVIHDARGGAIIALDEAGTAVWRTLVGDPPAGFGPDALQASAMRGFVEQLANLGFVHLGARHGDQDDRLAGLPLEEFEPSGHGSQRTAIIRRYDDGLVAWSPSSPRPTPLTDVQAVVFQILDGSGTVAELVRDIHEVVGVSEAVARGQLQSVLGPSGLVRSHRGYRTR